MPESSEPRYTENVLDDEAVYEALEGEREADRAAKYGFEHMPEHLS